MSRRALFRILEGAFYTNDAILHKEMMNAVKDYINLAKENNGAFNFYAEVEKEILMIESVWPGIDLKERIRSAVAHPMKSSNAPAYTKLYSYILEKEEADSLDRKSVV